MRITKAISSTEKCWSCSRNINLQDHYVLRAKTGWAFDKHIGWWVGYVERDNNVYFFALNIDIKKEEDTGARTTITKNILREMKIIDDEPK